MNKTAVEQVLSDFLLELEVVGPDAEAQIVAAMIKWLRRHPNAAIEGLPELKIALPWQPLRDSVSRRILPSVGQHPGGNTTGSVAEVRIIGSLYVWTLPFQSYRNGGVSNLPYRSGIGNTLQEAHDEVDRELEREGWVFATRSSSTEAPANLDPMDPANPWILPPGVERWPPVQPGPTLVPTIAPNTAPTPTTAPYLPYTPPGTADPYPYVPPGTADPYPGEPFPSTGEPLPGFETPPIQYETTDHTRATSWVVSPEEYDRRLRALRAQMDVAIGQLGTPEGTMFDTTTFDGRDLP